MMHPQAFPLDGSAVLNDRPVACQIREPTDPQGDRCPHIPAALAATYPLRCFAPQWARFDNRHSTSAPDPTLAQRQRQPAQGLFRAPAQALHLSPTAPFLPTAEEMGERTPAETTFLHFLSALRLFAAVRFPSRNRCFPDRCRSADCASTAFRCRCLLLRQILFVLPCRRLRNNYILCPTGTPTFAAARRQRRDLIIATRPAHQPLPSHSVSGSGASGTSDPPNRQRYLPYQFREISTANFA